jgi:hypothetical protein
MCATQHSTAQHSTAQHSTAQHSTALARRGDWIRRMRFWSGITRGGERRSPRQACCRTPSTPKPGHLTQSPHLRLLALGRVYRGFFSQGTAGLLGYFSRVQTP